MSLSYIQMLKVKEHLILLGNVTKIQVPVVQGHCNFYGTNLEAFSNLSKKYLSLYDFILVLWRIQYATHNYFNFSEQSLPFRFFTAQMTDRIK